MLNVRRPVGEIEWKVSQPLPLLLCHSHTSDVPCSSSSNLRNLSSSSFSPPEIIFFIKPSIGIISYTIQSWQESVSCSSLRNILSSPFKPGSQHHPLHIFLDHYNPQQQFINKTVYFRRFVALRKFFNGAPNGTSLARFNANKKQELPPKQLLLGHSSFSVHAGQMWGGNIYPHKQNLKYGNLI